ncbi:hypothetical protein HY214_01730 [Candidatus Roizmanbacteria bacterium]|nr:hypothetical protein [Candidatus Roizmanbacteria bacterium]
MNPEIIDFVLKGVETSQAAAPFVIPLGLAILALTHSRVNEPIPKGKDEWGGSGASKREQVLHQVAVLKGRIEGAKFDRAHGLSSDRAISAYLKLAVLNILYHGSLILSQHKAMMRQYEMDKKR